MTRFEPHSTLIPRSICLSDLFDSEVMRSENTESNLYLSSVGACLCLFATVSQCWSYFIEIFAQRRSFSLPWYPSKQRFCYSCRLQFSRCIFSALKVCWNDLWCVSTQSGVWLVDTFSDKLTVPPHWMRFFCWSKSEIMDNNSDWSVCCDTSTLRGYQFWLNSLPRHKQGYS